MGAKLLELRPLNNIFRIDVDIIVNGASQSLRAPFTFITNNDQTYAKRTLCLVSYEKIGDFLWWLRKKSYLCNQNEDT